jgi:hypothetical protein
MFMSDQHESSPPPDPLDRLATALLECGGVLSQIVGRMVEFDAAGRSAPDAAPIPEVAQTLVRSVLDEVGGRHSKRDVRLAAMIVSESTHAICENIFFVGPDLN